MVDRGGVSMPVDPTIAAASGAVMHFLAGYFKDVVGGSAKQIGGDTTKNALAKGQKLVDLLKAKLHGHSEASTALAKVEQNPNNAAVQLELKTQLAQVMQQDEAFTTQVTGLLKELAATRADVNFVNNIQGEVQKLVQIGTVVGDVNL
jgi:hypothetical protein